jgi:hypothetical protein
MLPADQRLDRDDPAVWQLDDRLVDQPELAGVERGADLGAEPGPLVGAIVQFGGVPVALLAARLGCLQGSVRPAQQLARVAGTAGCS